MSVSLYRGSPGKFDSRTLSRETLSRWTGRRTGWETWLEAGYGTSTCVYPGVHGGERIVPQHSMLHISSTIHASANHVVRKGDI